MWKLWQMARNFNKLPSEVFGETDSIAAWQLNEAVNWFGVTIENLLMERVKVGAESHQKYSLTRLLHPLFRLPMPEPERIEISKQKENPWSVFFPWIGKPGSGVHRWVYVPPTDDEKEH